MGGDAKADPSKKPQQSPQQPSPPSKDPLEEPSKQLHKSPAVVVVTGAPFASPPLFDQFESLNPKRPRYGAASGSTSTGQWKLLPSPSQVKQTQMAVLSGESTPSPTTTTTPQTQQPQPTPPSSAAAVSSSDTASSPPPPTHSPVPSLSGQDTGTKPESTSDQLGPHQFRKGKYVSPVWKPHEMLWLARAWRIQYQSNTAEPSSIGVDPPAGPPPTSRGKTRADKDREVAEFLNRHGVNRDAKTAGTKWDNMLGEFRKVYEWERGGEREQVGKSYFRLSPYERKIHRLPASFDEEVFEELSQFMGSRMRSSSPSLSHHTVRSAPAINVSVSTPTTHHHHDHDIFTTTTTPRTVLFGSGAVGAAPRSALPPPPHCKDDDQPTLSTRTKQLVLGGTAFHGGGLLGFDSSSLLDIGSGSSSGSKETLRRVGKIRMIWEESVTLWGEEGEQPTRAVTGRVKIGGTSFLNADELAFLDDSMVASTMEAFEDGPLKGFSVDRFVSGQQLKVFGRRKQQQHPRLSSTSALPHQNVTSQFPATEPSLAFRSIPTWDFQDPTEYYVGCLRVPPQTLPSLFELSWHVQEPPPEELRLPLRKDVFRDLPQGKDLFFTTSLEPLDCRAFTYDVLGPIIRTNPSISAGTATSRDSFIGLWDDCINRVVSKFCSLEMSIIRKPSYTSSAHEEAVQDQWPNVTGFVRNFCLWRGEETDQLREGNIDPSSSIVLKLLWTYMDLPYLLGYYAVGYIVTFCALSRSQDRVIRTDLYSVDISSPAERFKALVPCYRIAGLLPLLADRCLNMSIDGRYKIIPFSDFERVEVGNGNMVMEMTPNTVTRLYSSRRKWVTVKEIYDFLDHRVPHAEQMFRSSERELALVFRPRGCKVKPANVEQLVEALKYVTKALVALHDLSFMHRDLSWDKVVVVRRSEGEGTEEWVVCGFDEAASAPQIHPQQHGAEARGRHAPEMGRAGKHGVKVDVWGVGHLVKTCGLAGVPKMLRELQNRCLDPIPELRPTAADCYHHLLQLQSQSATGVGGY